jgi:hypothetical protein
MYQILLQLPALLGVLVVAASPVASTPVNATDLTKRASRWGFPYGSTKVRGVNLGGWLVLEVSPDEASSDRHPCLDGWLTCCDPDLISGMDDTFTFRAIE